MWIKKFAYPQNVGNLPIFVKPFTQLVCELFTKMFVEQPQLHWVVLLVHDNTLMHLYLAKLI